MRISDFHPRGIAGQSGMTVTQKIHSGLLCGHVFNFHYYGRKGEYTLEDSKQSLPQGVL